MTARKAVAKQALYELVDIDAVITTEDRFVTLDKTDPFEAVLVEMAEMARKKRADYTGTGEEDLPFQNFYDSAIQVSSTPGMSAEVHIATKQARLKVLMRDNREAQNESIRDSKLDRAVYSAIALALHDEGSYDADWLTK